MSDFWNRVMFRASGGGTGAFSVSTAITGYRTPAQANLPDGAVVDYTAESDDRTQWETGRGTYTSGSLSRDTIRESSNSDLVVNFSAAPRVWVDQHAHSIRNKPTATRTVYVRVNLGDVSLSIASPAVASIVGHGLSVDDPVVFSKPEDRTECTFSIASPGKVNATAHPFANGDLVRVESTGYCSANLDFDEITFTLGSPGVVNSSVPHGLANGDQVKFYTIGVLPNEVLENTVYYVANKTATTFEIEPATSPGTGSSIAFTGMTSGYHFMYRVSGLPTGLSPHTNYYVANAGANDFELEASPGGGSINFTLSAAGTSFVYRWATLPTGVVEGQVYYVISAGLTSDTFQFSETVSGSAVNTSGSQSGIHRLSTGNDNNTGRAQTRAGALLSIQAAVDQLMTDIDLNNQSIDYIIRCAESTYRLDTQVTLGNYFGEREDEDASFNSRRAFIQGDTDDSGGTAVISNCRITNTESSFGHVRASGYACKWFWRHFHHISGRSVTTAIGVSLNAHVVIGSLQFSNPDNHNFCQPFSVAADGVISTANDFFLNPYVAIRSRPDGGTYRRYVQSQSRGAYLATETIELYDFPAFSTAFVYVDGFSVVTMFCFVLGPANCSRFLCTAFSALNLFGSQEWQLPGITEGTFSGKVNWVGNHLGDQENLDRRFPVELTDAASIEISAEAGHLFHVETNGDRTLLPPDFAPKVGETQRFVLRHKAIGSNRTLTLTTGVEGAYRFGSTITGLTATVAGTSDYITFEWNGFDLYWDVVDVVKGY